MTESHKEIIIFGCGGHARSVADIILLNSPGRTLLFVDENARDGEKLFGFPVVVDVFAAEKMHCIVGIGNNEGRRVKFESLVGWDVESVISKRAHLGQDSFVGRGVFIGNFCHIGPEAVIGENTIINNAAVVEHEVKVGSHSHIGPNATISGRCNIGDNVFVGVGSTVKDSINICSNVTIGAGATVIKDINVPGVYVGTPAKLIGN